MQGRFAAARGIGVLAVAGLLVGCTQETVDWDLRAPDRGISTSAAARNAAARPAADPRGVISYPGYQVAVANRGETVADIARRLGVPLDALARDNALEPGTRLAGGEVLILPSRIAEIAPSADAGGGGITSTTLAPPQGTLAAPATARAAPVMPEVKEPVRHVVGSGETAWQIARLYDVNVRALADWNGLDADYNLRVGQTLLIPPAGTLPGRVGGAPAPAADAAEAPGQGSQTPPPPSAAEPLPTQETGEVAPAAEAEPAAEAAPPAPEAAAAVPNLGEERTEASAALLAMPADGPVVRPYEKGKNEGIGIGAAAGSPVRAAADGTVAAITQDTDQVPIIVIRHADNLLTVYANVEGISVAKDATVRRGQTIAAVRPGNPTFLHFEVRRGFESVDPMTLLQ
jgi:murein DD-endopeptidase MepM/ murein hydrolase activator NlpD